MKKLTLNQVKDKYIGKQGTQARCQYEFDLKIDLLGEMIKKPEKKET